MAYRRRRRVVRRRGSVGRRPRGRVVRARSRRRRSSSVKRLRIGYRF